MAAKPTTVAAYFRAAPAAALPHLRRLQALLREVAPEAEETIKWGAPFFVEPRFLFAYSAHKAHLNFTPSPMSIARRTFPSRLELNRPLGSSSDAPFAKVSFTAFL